jgi:hypothetical protein
MRSFCSGYGGCRLLLHGQATCRGRGTGLNYRVISTEQGKPVWLPVKGSTPQGAPMAMRVAEMRRSEGCSVIEQIEVTSPPCDNSTSPETEPTSRWCSNWRPLEVPRTYNLQLRDNHCLHGFASWLVPRGWQQTSAAWTRWRTDSRSGTRDAESWPSSHN